MHGPLEHPQGPRFRRQHVFERSRTGGGLRPRPWSRASQRAGRKWVAYGVVVVIMTCALLWSALTPGLMLRLAGLLLGALFLMLTIVMGRAD